ncbi:MAG: B12-binding domain-containing protein, partial [Thiohalorhabdaceae bacterium]
ALAEPPSEGRRALFACVPTNQHEVGLRILADGFELEGWRTEFLGADTPVPALIERVRQFRPEVVGLSVALVRQIPQLQTAVAELREGFGGDCPRLIAGGAGLQGLPGGWEQLGLDGCCDQPQDALEELS